MRRFHDYVELNDHLHSLSVAEIQRYRESARDFLRAPRFQPFTKQAFAELFAQLIQEDTGIRLNEMQAPPEGARDCR
jgi:hypothetical protein